MSNRAALIIAAPYIGLVVASGVLAALNTPEYQHVSYLHMGVIGLAWSLVAITCLLVFAIRLRRDPITSRMGRPWLTAALQAPIVLLLIALLPSSIALLQAYEGGIVAYDAAFEACGGPPVLAQGGWGAHITLPSNPDYDRLKYSTKDFLQFGPPIVYFCSAADAEAHGYPMVS
jgi:hypothetical protein